MNLNLYPTLDSAHFSLSYSHSLSAIDEDANWHGDERNERDNGECEDHCVVAKSASHAHPTILLSFELSNRHSHIDDLQQ